MDDKNPFFKWPSPVSSLKAQVLRKMSNQEFHKLRTLVEAREFKRTGSKRRAKELGRYLSRLRHPYQDASIEKGNVSHFWQRKKSRILDAFYPERNTKWQPYRKRAKNQELALKNFSFIDNPVETINGLKEIARLESIGRDAKVHFDDIKVNDVGPYLVFGLMQEDMTGFTKGGRMTEGVQKVLNAIGIDAFSRIHTKARQQAEQGEKAENIWPFKLRHFRTTQMNSINYGVEGSSAEKVNDDLVETIDAWLRELGSDKQLTGRGRSWISNLIGETLCNAERHSRSHGKGSWSVVGFMSQTDDKDTNVKLCHLSVASLGKTISESLLDGVPAARDATMAFCKGKRRTNLSNDTLATLYAVQDGVTRMPKDIAEGGFGLMDIIQMVNELGRRSEADSYPPQAVIVSGKSCIMFKNQYNIGLRNPITGAREQFFNPENDKNKLPDRDFVFDLPVFLPGTLISVRFALSNDTVIA